MKYIFIIVLIFIIIILGVVFIKNNKSYKIENIKSLEFHYTTGTAINADVLYKIECENKCILTIKENGIRKENAKVVEINNDVLKEVEDVLNEYQVSKWDEFNKSDKNVLDGNSFTFYVHMKDKGVSASGYMKYPKNYKEVKKKLENIFNRYR